ncbi:acetate kinase [Nitrosomonas eutropha]|uniref:Acetate kinase n=1 Tax=Nitrosomonas eutropha TaxID=916 RepID=A0A1I7IPD9_9PROT|nr:acetate/propionate family kinase [Nitrosomonas eutropha]SFU74774.1 acetate kinase [Nitrosomonas eutropha]
MNETILVLNAGSSSIKYALYRTIYESISIICRGKIEIGSNTSSQFQVRDSRGELLWQQHLHVPHHESAIEVILQWLETQTDKQWPTVAGHRVVHGGILFDQPVIINEQVITQLFQLVPLAPLHQLDSLVGIETLKRLKPDLPQVACFDTSFHRTMPDEERIYALPGHLTDQGIQRYGFHGLSYEYIAHILHDHLGDRAAGRIVVAHLGNGASLCALRQGKSIATTMGFTPLEGLPMGTRCGNLDPAVLLYLMREQQMNHDMLTDLLYRHAGLLGVSGISADMRTLLASDAPRAKHAVDLFIWQVCRQLGAMIAVLEGIDGLIFTAGIGEHAPQIRARICGHLKWLSIKLDESANQANAIRISTAESHIPVLVLPTDEESIIAHHTLRLIMT